MKKFIFTADWHLRGDLPRCRVDEDWIETQRHHIRSVADLSLEHKCPIVIAGDIFHRPRVAYEVTAMAIQELKRAESVYIMAGNHDLPYHSYDNEKQSAYGILKEFFPDLTETSFSNRIAFKFGQEEGEGRETVFTHQLTFESEEKRPFPGVGKTAAELLEEFPKATYIFTGDMHRAFVYESGGRFVVNAGSLNRQVADAKDYTPSVYLVERHTNSFERILVPDAYELVTDEYLTDAEERDDRMLAFVAKLTKSEGASLSFRDNLERKLRTPDLSEEVKTIINEIVEVLNDDAGT